MLECFRCGADGGKVNLHKVISKTDGIVYVCDNCLEYEEDLPEIKKRDPSKPAPGQTVYERLSRSARLNPVEHRKNVYNPEKQKLIEKNDGQLKTVISKSINEQKKRVEPRADLIDNFRWKIMRERRSRKMSQEQLAETIMEPISSIKLAEEGIIANWDDKLVDKLERYLRISLRRDFSERRSMNDAKEAMLQEISKGSLSFTPEVARNFTIADLSKLKEHGVEISGEELEKLQEQKEEVIEEKKPSFFLRLFGRKKKKEEIPEEEEKDLDEEDEFDDDEEEIKK